MKPKSKADSVRWAENRLDSYSGSFRNFISAVYNSKVEEEGFSLFSGEFQALVDGYGKYVSPDKLIVISEVSSSLKRFYIDKCYKIKYREYLKSFSIMCPVKNYALIDRWGNVVNPIAVETAGDWTRDRISNLLPDNYEPGGTK